MRLAAVNSTRRQTVSPELWEYVVARDARAIWEHLWSRISYGAFLQMRRPICIVELADPLESLRCSGYQTVDHVKDGPMMGKRAPSDEHHLVAMCSFHNVEHPPSKELRAFERYYLGLGRDE